VLYAFFRRPLTTYRSFIVIFCNAIQNTDATDVASLQEFVDSLESCRVVSVGADNLYKMCHLFLQVARLYLQAKTQDNTPDPQSFMSGQPNYYTAPDGTQLDLNAMTSFDPYLSALGLMPNSAWPGAGYDNQPGVDEFSNGQGTRGLDDFNGFDMFGTGLSGTGGNQNSVQDWFSGSRYLMTLMEGEDTQMPDLNF
jgi:hypothetical protein